MNAVLEIHDVAVRFGMVTAADGLTLSIARGELVGLIGPNGAGKTTFLNLVTGYTRPDEGRILVLGKEITGKHPSQVTAMGVGRSFQTPQLFLDLTVVENVLLALAAAEGISLRWWRRLRQHDREERAHAILRRFGLEADGDRRATQIAEGTRKILDVALAFALAPKLLLMDEPTSGVSIDTKFDVMDTLVSALRDEGVTALFVEHDMDVVRRYAERVLVLSEGRIIADGTPDHVLADEVIRRSVAG
ncbi:MAG: ABC transporter ATP-binding protein [Pseudonocardiaceae bacterium]